MYFDHSNLEDMMNVPKMMIGTFRNNNYQELFDVVCAAVECGFTGFDTAPSYKSEKVLGRAIHEAAQKYGLGRKDFFISDKIDAWQMQECNGDIRRYVDEAMNQMDIEYIDLLLIHWPIPEYMDRTWKCFEKLYGSGIVKSIGICNLRVRHLEKYIQYDIPPQFLQIERHPLRTCQQELKFCKDHGIKVMSYSPICQMDTRLRNSKILQRIAEKYDKNIGQVILRWHIDTECIPVFMSKKKNRIKENLDIFDFHLEKDEIDEISSLNENYKIFLESWGCLGF